MEVWFWPLVRALLVGVVLMALAWLSPGLVDSTALTNRLLQASYQLPELVSSYVPDLLLGVRLSLVVAVAWPLVLFAVWALAMRLALPTGPAQVARRLVVWLAVAVAAPVGVFFATTAWALGRLDTVDGAAANRLATAVAVLALLLFWGFSLLGAERMMRPAVLGGTALRVRA